MLHQLPTEACVFIRYAAAHRLTDPPYNLEPEPNDLSCGPWEQGRFRHFDDDDDEKFPNGYLNAVRSHSVLLFFCANRIRPSFHTCRLLWLSLHSTAWTRHRYLVGSKKEIKFAFIIFNLQNK